MVARSRSRVYTRASGGRWVNNNPSVVIGAGMIPTELAICNDQVDVNDCFPLEIEKRSTSGGDISKYSTGAFSSQFRNYPCDWLRTMSNGYHLGVSGVPSNVEVSTSTAARTNPSRPYVDVPVNILDIRSSPLRIRQDIVDMMGKGHRRAPPRPSNRDLRRGAGDAWLQYQFLIAPIVGDIVRLASAVEQIDRRVEEINRLYTGHGIRRTVTCFSGSSQSQINQTVQSAGTVISRQFNVNTSVTRRCHIRWKPTNRCGLNPSPRQVNAWAGRSVYGITIDASTLWELTPWSWLADYFGNVGTYLKASRNIIPARVVGVHPMTHTKTTWECQGTQITDGSFSGIRLVRESKQRYTSFVAPYAHFGFLNASQMGILAALIASR